jgi:hypothetical protein
MMRLLKAASVSTGFAFRKIIAAVSAAAMAIGHLSGPNDPSEKTILAVECGVRHPVLALTIAVANFGKSLAVAALLPLLPLVLFKYPLADLLAKFFERLSGL